MQETGVQSLGWEEPLEKGMTAHSSILPGESHEERSLACYSPWGYKESDTTERLSLKLKLKASFRYGSKGQAMLVGNDVVAQYRPALLLISQFPL